MSLFQYPTVASLSEYLEQGKIQNDIEQQALERTELQRKALLKLQTRKKVFPQ
jgi:hypothetical protein